MLVNTSQQLDRWRASFPRTQAGWGNGALGEGKGSPGSEGYYNPPAVADSWLGLLVNVFNVGSVASFFITPYVADHWGRKTSIAIGCSFMICGGFICAFCIDYEMFVAGRFLLGFGNSLAQMASPLLLTEICHPQHRGPVTAVYNCLWNLGALMVAWAGWGTARIASDWSWRTIALLQVLPSAVQLSLLAWIPESPRYLVSRDRHGEALDTLARCHARGGRRDDLLVRFEYREICDAIRSEHELVNSTAHGGGGAGYLDFLRTRGNRWRLAILVSLGVISQYSGNALFSNYIDAVYDGAGVTSQNTKLAISGGKTILDLIVTVLAALNVDRFGRRPLFLLSISGMVVSFASWTACGAAYEYSGLSSLAAGYAQLVFVWLFGIFYDVGFSGLLVAYALEILPFGLRAKGMMVMNVTLQAVLALSNQSNKVAWNRLPRHWYLMLMYTLWDFCELVFVYFFYVETKGPTLEEIARIFDGPDAVADVSMQQVVRDIHEAAELRDEGFDEKDVDAYVGRAF
ncbi:general substrate transporter [Xylariaceae sp. FL0804]|nr:general substrate transporter [Xylariaceae sp. FL0804]